MFDRVHPGSEGCGDAVIADGVRCNFLPDAVGFVDKGLCFFVREINVAVKDAVRTVEVTVVGVVLDPVRAMHHLLADRLAYLFNAIDVLNAGGHFEFPGITEKRVHARWRHGACGDLHVRAGDFAIVDGFLHVSVGVHSAFGLQVAKRSETVRKRNLGVARSKNGPIRDGLLE